MENQSKTDAFLHEISLELIVSIFAIILVLELTGFIKFIFAFIIKFRLQPSPSDLSHTYAIYIYLYIYVCIFHRSSSIDLSYSFTNDYPIYGNISLFLMFP